MNSFSWFAVYIIAYIVFFPEFFGTNSFVFEINSKTIGISDIQYYLYSGVNLAPGLYIT